MNYAGFWQRFLAALIDGILLGIVQRILSGGLGQQSASGGGLLIAWLYYALMESSATQGTLGKMALGIQVVDTEGNRVSFGRATGRYFAKIVSAIILLIGFLMAAWTEKKQGLHDIMAGTLVVRKGQASA